MFKIEDYTSRTRLNLRPNVMYVTLTDPNSETFMAKIISIDGNKSWEPNNYTAALLLYVLAREPNNSIHYPDLLTLIEGKFNNPNIGELNQFLDELGSEYILHKDEGSNAGGDRDPVGLFGSPKIDWATPHVQETATPIIKGKRFYTTNWGAWAIPR